MILKRVKMGCNNNKKVFLCIAISIILVVGLMAFASAAGSSDSGFFKKIVSFFKNLFGGKGVAGNVIDQSCPCNEEFEVCDNSGGPGIGICNGAPCTTEEGYPGLYAWNPATSSYYCSSTKFCGDGEINGPEICDGADLNGQTCASVMGSGYTGTLGCYPASAGSSACKFDTTQCSAMPGCVFGGYMDALDCRFDTISCPYATPPYNFCGLIWGDGCTTMGCPAANGLPPDIGPQFCKTACASGEGAGICYECIWHPDTGICEQGPQCVPQGPGDFCYPNLRRCAEGSTGGFTLRLICNGGGWGTEEDCGDPSKYHIGVCAQSSYAPPPAMPHTGCVECDVDGDGSSPGASEPGTEHEHCPQCTINQNCDCNDYPGGDPAGCPTDKNLCSTATSKCAICIHPNTPENCNDGIDNNCNGYCDTKTSTCTDMSIPGDPECEHTCKLVFGGLLQDPRFVLQYPGGGVVKDGDLITTTTKLFLKDTILNKFLGDKVANCNDYTNPQNKDISLNLNEAEALNEIPIDWDNSQYAKGTARYANVDPDENYRMGVDVCSNGNPPADGDWSKCDVHFTQAECLAGASNTGFTCTIITDPNNVLKYRVSHQTSEKFTIRPPQACPVILTAPAGCSIKDDNGNVVTKIKTFGDLIIFDGLNKKRVEVHALCDPQLVNPAAVNPADGGSSFAVEVKAPDLIATPQKTIVDLIGSQQITKNANLFVQSRGFGVNACPEAKTLDAFKACVNGGAEVDFTDQQCFDVTTIGKITCSMDAPLYEVSDIDWTVTGGGGIAAIGCVVLHNLQAPYTMKDENGKVINNGDLIDRSQGATAVDVFKDDNKKKANFLLGCWPPDYEDIDLRPLTIDAPNDATTTSDFGASVGLSGDTHTLLVTGIYNSGVDICPVATSVATFTPPNCTGWAYIPGGWCDGNAHLPDPNNPGQFLTYICAWDGSQYAISGLPTSGVGARWDSMPRGADNCWDAYNPDQTDSDGDCNLMKQKPAYWNGAAWIKDPHCGDACDNCWYVNNTDQNDTDRDCNITKQNPLYFNIAYNAWIQDPHCGDACSKCAPPLISFVNPTPANGTVTTDASAVINTSIILNACSLKESKKNWNGINYTFYNDSLVLMMNFDNRSVLGENATKAVDVSNYRNNGTISGATWTSSGKYGGAYTFNGASNYINLSRPIAGIQSANYSISAWVKSGAIGATIREIFYQGYDGAHEFRLELAATTCYATFNTYEVAYGTVLGTTSVCDGNWHYLTAVKSGNTGYIYVDGNQQNSGAVKNATSTDRATIGAARYTGGIVYFFSGSIDEVRVWNRSLSAAEIKQQYYSNLNKYDTNKWMLYENEILPAGTNNYQVCVKNTDEVENCTETRILTRQINYPGINFVSPTPANGTVTTDASAVINVSITNSPNLKETKKNWNGINYTFYNDSLVLMYNFDNVPVLGESATKAIDVSKYRNNGTLVNGTAWTSSGKYNSALSFDGVDDFVSTPDSSSLHFSGANDWTISAWVYPLNLQGTTFFDKSANTGGVEPGQLDLWYHLSLAGKVVCQLGLEGTAWETVTSIGSYTVNAWNYVTCVKSGSTQYVYVNGNLDNSVAMSYIPSATANSHEANIGRFRRAPAGTTFNGSIDEVRVWNKALSAAEIKQQYYSNLNKYAVDKWMLSENEILTLGANNYQACVKNTDGIENCTETRLLTRQAKYPGISFVSPTPANGTVMPNSSAVINISITDTTNAQQIKKNWNGINYTFYNDSLVLMMNFNNVPALGESATKAVDVSKYGNNGTLVNSIAWTSSGKYGGAYTFDGINKYITLPTSYMGQINHTECAWFKTSSPSAAQVIYAERSSTSGTPIRSQLYHYLSKIYYIGRDDSNVGTSAIGTTTLLANTWYYACGVKAGAATYVYLNGILEGTNLSSVGTFAADRFTIGAYYYQPSAAYLGFFNGTIDEVRIWNKALSAAEILQQYYSNLNKYDTDKWMIYENESNLTLGNTYSYQGCVKDIAGNENCTETRLLIVSQFVCGNNIVEGTEVCDGNSRACTVGGYNGMQTCKSDCTGWNQCMTGEFCGDGIINDAEQCDDGSSQTPTSCGVGACARTVADNCVSCVNQTCTPGVPAANDATCNGIDDNCNGQVDEGYIPTPTTCGVGACAATGQLICVNGVTQDTCTPGTPAANDANCNNIDDNCNGAVDEGYVSMPTTCGVGACHATGTTSCVNGVVIDSCTPGTPSANDDNCNGIDDNCNGQIDEHYVPQATTCGVGACASTGTTSCVNGAEQDSCVAGIPAADDANCNGVDDNCNGLVDEGYVSRDTTCGVGACASTGTTSCVNGAEQDSCVAGTPAANDKTCNGIDDNCNGLIDEDYVSLTTNCGTGACQATGATSCVNGAVEDSCIPGTPAANDETCNGIDDNCNGQVDENYAPHATTCGVGACASTGMTSCVNGAEQDSCAPGTPAGIDDSCNGIDDNCNGAVDEDYVSEATTCGIGACASTGATSCVNGVVIDSCVAGTPAADDSSCNGIDDNCNGFVDEDYVSQATTCGVGACHANGATSCVDGQVYDSCIAGTPAANDETCNGIDDNCNGQIDEHYVPQVTTCGVGACERTGMTSCVAGVEQDSCTPGTPTTEICNGIDDNCNGEVDESLGQTTCGLGECYHTIDNCVAGQTQTCNPLEGQAPEVCDGKDNNCNGIMDDGLGTTTCGLGICSHTIDNCANGEPQTCNPFEGAGLESCEDNTGYDGLDNNCDGTVDLNCNSYCDQDGDGYTPHLICLLSGGYPLNLDCDDTNANIHPGATEVCNGIDDNCNGNVDEDLGTTTCGLGICSHTIDNCVDGEPQTCNPLEGATTEVCNGLDDNCNGEIDEGGVCQECGNNIIEGTEVCDGNSQACTVGGYNGMQSCNSNCTGWNACTTTESCGDGIINDAEQCDDGSALTPVTCGIGACQVTVPDSCVNCVNQICTPGIPAADDANCNGVDDNCNGNVDEGYIPTPTTCGVGACAATGQLICVNGVTEDTCTPGTPASNDATCNGIDDNCNGAVDEDYVSLTTQCGTGACHATGETSCVDGKVVDSCTPGTPASNDATCNGIDDNCNGQVDENYVPQATTCGVGACASTGTTSCVNGAEQDSCTPGMPAAIDDSCNNIDDNCNGQVDENYVSRNTTCGVGACASTGTTSCVAGVEQDSCAAGIPAANDETCNGIDDNCNGLIDEDYVPLTTNCGAGACQATGTTSCVNGAVEDSCIPGTPAANDDNCNGIDDNCNGQVDENYVPRATTCGVGACASTGTTSCVNGAEQDSCTPGMPATNDDNCNGIDDNCNGNVDEGYVPTPTTCGVGACASTGTTSCVNGAEQDSCVAGTPAADDSSCDGIDNNCNGFVDEDYVSQATTCGVGACGATGATSCVNGQVYDSCVAGTPAANDETCNGIDDNCNGQIDENYVPHATTCGVGACASTGMTSCVNGVEQDSCVAGTPAGIDDSCNGIDDNCNGQIDENYVSKGTTCGIGACSSFGATSCVDGIVVDSCVAGTPAADDSSCDGIDNNCNGFVDEDYVSQATTCGVGACGATGATSCVNGQVYDSCVAGTPAANDETCNGIDDNCNGKIDENYVSLTTTCGVGACERTGTTSCVGGVEQDSCTPGTPTTEICNGIDDNCNGELDENLGQTTCGLGECYHTIDNCMGGQTQTCNPLQGQAPEVCDGKDNNCNGIVDDGLGTTTCGLGICSHTIQNCVGGAPETCNPFEGAVPESCTDGTGYDGLDNNCDGNVDLNCDSYCDVDGDGYTPHLICLLSGKYPINLDCNDNNANVHPGAAEICDGIDNNCNGNVDENLGQTTCGLGICLHTVQNCIAGVPQTCNPLQGATTEVCNGLDDNCNGQVDELLATDADHDGVNDCNGDDWCLNSIADNIVLDPNQYAQNNLLTSAYECGPRNDQSIVYNMQNTHGCTCRQTATLLNVGVGQVKKGCSPGIMQKLTGLAEQPDRAAGIGKK